MPVPVLAVITAFLSGLTAVIAAKLLLAGLVVGLGYKYYDPINDLVHSHVLDEEAGRARDDDIRDYIDDICVERNLSAEDCLLLRMKLENDIATADHPSFLDDIANKLGVSAETLKYMIMGLVGFLLLKG